MAAIQRSFRIRFDLNAIQPTMLMVTPVKMNKQKSRKTEYPEDTIGSKLAAEARKSANSLTDEERAEALEGAKSLIYGRVRHKQAIGSRR